MKRNTSRSGGFTLFEVFLALALIGVVTAFAAPALTRTFDISDAMTTLDQNRDLQKPAAIYFAEHGRAPNMPTLNEMYSGGVKAKSIFGKYTIVSIDALHKTPGADPQGDAASDYVICSIMPLRDAEYVYSYDDLAPRIAPKGADPVGLGVCGAAAICKPPQDPKAEAGLGWLKQCARPFTSSSTSAARVVGMVD